LQKKFATPIEGQTKERKEKKEELKKRDNNGDLLLDNLKHHRAVL